MCDSDIDQYWISTPKARKRYFCTECQKPIEIGEKYCKTSYVTEGSVYNEKQCLQCADLFVWVQQNNLIAESTYSHPGNGEEPGCLYFGELRQTVHEFYDRLPKELISPKFIEEIENGISKKRSNTSISREDPFW